MPYTYSQLKTDVSNRLHNKLGRISSVRNSINLGVKSMVTLPMKSTVRRYSEPIRLVDGVNDYFCPADLQSAKVIDVRPITESRPNRYGWRNTHPECFDRLRSMSLPVLTVTNDGPLRFLKASAMNGDTVLTVSGLDSTADGGTWSAVGSATSVETDASSFLYGNGSVKFNLGSGVKDGIQLAMTSAADISGYRADGSAYLSLSLPSATGVTAVFVRLGSDASNYLEVSATADISGNTITAGWNTFRLKLSSGTETGTPDYASIDYAAVLVGKGADPLVGVRADRLMVGNGAQHYIEYYSRYAWRSASGTWQADSALDTDILNADEEEYQMLVEACVEQCALAAREYADADRSANKLKELKAEYRMNNFDRSMITVSDVWQADSIN